MRLQGPSLKERDGQPARQMAMGGQRQQRNSVVLKVVCIPGLTAEELYR